jgi:hypothetical protein
MCDDAPNRKPPALATYAYDSTTISKIMLDISANGLK